MSQVLAIIKKMMCYQGSQKHANFMYVRVYAYACTCAGLGVSRHVRACFKAENAGMCSQRCSDGVVGFKLSCVHDGVVGDGRGIWLGGRRVRGGEGGGSGVPS